MMTCDLLKFVFPEGGCLISHLIDFVDHLAFLIIDGTVKNIIITIKFP